MGKVIKRLTQAPLAFVTSADTRQRDAISSYYRKVDRFPTDQQIAEESYLKDGFSAVLQRESGQEDAMLYCHSRSKWLSGLSENEYVQTILRLRSEQVAQFADYSTDGYSKGWRIRPAYSDPSRSIYSMETSKDIETLSAAVQNLGFGGELDSKECFSRFLHRCVLDKLIYGHITVELIRNRNNGKISHWRHRPASTIGVMNNHSLRKVYAINGENPKYFQQIDGSVQTVFWPSEMVFHVTDWDHRNPKTQYGYPPLMKAHTIIEDLNRFIRQVHLFYKQGYHGNKLLAFSGTGQEKTNEAAKRVRGYLSGTEASYRLGVIDQGEGAQVIDIASAIDPNMLTLKDANVRLLCAMFAMSPEEVNQPMDDHQVSRDRTGRAADKTVSKQNGLPPILMAVSDLMNNYILSIISGGKYIFEWVGNTPSLDESEHKYLMEASTTYLTVNEARRQRGLEPIPNGDVILNPVIQDLATDAAVKIQQMGMPSPSDKSSAISGDKQKALGVMEDW